MNLELYCLKTTKLILKLVLPGRKASFFPLLYSMLQIFYRIDPFANCFSISLNFHKGLPGLKRPWWAGCRATRLHVGSRPSTTRSLTYCGLVFNHFEFSQCSINLKKFHLAT